MQKIQYSNFESLFSAEENKAEVITFLRKENLPFPNKRYQLMEILWSCYPIEPCCSPSCHVCKRELRLKLIPYIQNIIKVKIH